MSFSLQSSCSDDPYTSALFITWCAHHTHGHISVAIVQRTSLLFIFMLHLASGRAILLQRATQSNIVLWAYSCVEVEQTCVQYRPKLGPGNIPSVARRLPLSLPQVQLVRENLDSLSMCAHVSILLIR